MNLTYKEKSIKVFEKSVVPAIKLNLTASINYNEIPLEFTAQLYSEENKFLTNLEQIEQNPSSMRRDIPLLVQGQNPSQKPEKYEYEMVGVLSKQVINYIEKRREKNKKNDVIFQVKATIKYLTTDINIEFLEEHQMHNPDIRIISRYVPAVGGSPALNILTSSGYLLSYYTYVSNDCSIIIPSSDWLHDFQEPLGIGRFMVIEIPDPRLLDDSLKYGSDELKTLIERIDSSQKIFKTMERLLTEGEWGRVIEESRKFFELYTKNVKGNIKKLIEKSTGISEESATKLTTALDNLEDYSNALHHSVNTKGPDSGTPTNVFTGGKEDAYLTFNLCASILNLVSKKVVSFLETDSK